MSCCRMSSTLALLPAVVGLSGGLAAPAAMAAFSPAPSPSPPAPSSPLLPPSPPSPSWLAPPAQVLPTAFSRFSVSLDQDGQLSYSGCLELPAGAPVAGTAGLSRPVIQYAPRLTGSWRTLTRATMTGVACGDGGEEFSGLVTARLNLAYYRAYFAGRSAAAGTGTRYLASVSRILLAWKYADRMTSFRVSPAVVAARGTLTVRGTLQYYYFGWHGYPGQVALIILRPKGRGTWYWIRQVTTGPGGHFSATFADPLSATWSAEYLGNGTHLATVAAMVYVRLAVNRQNATRGQTVINGLALSSNKPPY
jgi:hypothetical protein